MILQCFHFTLAPFWQHFFYISETLGSKEHRRNLGKDKKKLKVGTKTKRLLESVQGRSSGSRVVAASTKRIYYQALS
jgi:hypothetical protein